MSLVLSGSTSGSVTLQEPAVAGTTVLDLPATSGTLITTGSTNAVTTSMLAVGASNQSYFYAYRTSTQSSVTASTATQVQLNNVLQSGTSFNTGTYTFTATSADAGKWMFLGNVSFFVTTNDGDGFLPLLYYNGSIDVGNYGWIWESTDYVRHNNQSFSTVLNISTGDTVSLYGRCNAGTTISFFGGDTTGGLRQCSLIGVKIA
jgi:hypothetical protein